MDTNEESWRDEVVQKLVEVFKDEQEDLARILYFLVEEDKATRPYAPHWKYLKAIMKLDKAFREFAKRLSDDARRAEKDQELQRQNIPEMDTNEESWRDEVTKKLVEVFKGEEEDLCRILYFLDEEDKAYKDNVAQPYAPHWKSLKATVKLDKVFREFAKRLSDDARRAEKDQELHRQNIPVMDTNEESWREEVTEKLVEVFDGEQEDLCRTLYFLDEEDKAYKDSVARPYAPHWKSLKATVKFDKAFREYAKRLSDETRRAENDPEFRRRMNIVYEEMMSHCDERVPISDHQNFDSNQLLKTDSTSTSAFGVLARAWNIMPANSKVCFMNGIKAIGNKTLMTAADDVVRVASRTGGAVVMIGLAAVYLTYDAYVNITRWWDGEISGKRCIKNVLDSTFAIGAGMAGGLAGVALGSAVAGPIGTVVGGIVGGWVSAAGVGYLSDWMTQKMFGLPKEEALENAYRYLGVEMTASNAEINTAFRKLCLKHHPDKGGKQDDFFILQCNMGIIKLARRDF